MLLGWDAIGLLKLCYFCPKAQMTGNKLPVFEFYEISLLLLAQQANCHCNSSFRLVSELYIQFMFAFGHRKHSPRRDIDRYEIPAVYGRVWREGTDIANIGL